MVVLRMAVGAAAIHIFALLAYRLKLQRAVVNSVLLQLGPNLFLYFTVVRIRYNMHRCKVTVTVSAPDVNVMNILNAVNCAKVSFDFLYAYTIRCFFNEQLRCLFKVFHCIYKDKHCNRN